MNKFQIQKILFICFAISNIIIPLDYVYPSDLEKTLIINKKDGLIDKKNFLFLKILKKNQLMLMAINPLVSDLFCYLL